MNVSPAVEKMSPPIKSPLLPKQEPSSEKHGSTSGVVFNVSTSIIGAGIMSMPAAFKVLGVVPALLIITIIAWLSTISVGFLMKSTLAGEATTYAGVMKESFGKAGSVAVQEMCSPDPLHVIPATKISVILCAAIYFATGLFGYLLFGDATMSDILVNFDESSGSSIGSLLNDIVRLSYALHLMLVFPLMNFSLRANLDELMFPTMKAPLAKDTKRFVGLTLALLICCFLSAIAVPDIWYFFQFLGSTTTVSIAFIFPAAIVLRNVNGVSTSREKIVAAIMLVLAVATSIVAISTNLYSLTSK
ncbi:hypothetical protein HID58_082352 [Brassica napus]|uniref:Amino acid transporter transmembrane domain-containing protein n=1 Tax=Brassica napus TaxID=3708 RepID=A0ABQ7YAD4_BRANA|nr:hypothetical protein HID58_082352 [Brassica napus]